MKLAYTPGFCIIRMMNNIITSFILYESLVINEENVTFANDSKMQKKKKDTYYPSIKDREELDHGVFLYTLSDIYGNVSKELFKLSGDGGSHDAGNHYDTYQSKEKDGIIYTIDAEGEGNNDTYGVTYWPFEDNGVEFKLTKNFVIPWINVK